MVYLKFVGHFQERGWSETIFHNVLFGHFRDCMERLCWSTHSQPFSIWKGDYNGMKSGGSLETIFLCYILDIQMCKVSPLMTLLGWPQICRRDSSFMENTKSVTGQIKGQAQKRDMIDAIYIMVCSVLHKK